MNLKSLKKSSRQDLVSPFPSRLGNSGVDTGRQMEVKSIGPEKRYRTGVLVGRPLQRGGERSIDN